MRNMTLICRAYATSDVDIEERCPVYVVNLEESRVKDWIKKIQKTAELAEKDRDLYLMSYWSLPGDFMDLGKMDASVEGVQDLMDLMDEGGETFMVPTDSKMAQALDDAAERTTYDGGARIRTECRRTEVMNNSVMAHAIIKHTSIVLESMEVSLSELMGLLLEEAAA